MPEAGIYLNTDFFPFSSLQDYSGTDSSLLFCKAWMTGVKAYRIQSSGSTGKAREIIWQREQMEWSAAATGKALGVTPSDRSLLCLSDETAGGRMVLVRAMQWNIPVEVLPPSSDPLKLLSNGHKNTLLSLVPLQLSHILENQGSVDKLQKFRTVLLGGGPLSPVLEHRLRELKPAFYHTYGMTETCSHIALRKLNRHSKSERFQPFDGITLSLSEENTLIIDSPSAVERPLVTNDLAEIAEDRSFRLLGRRDFTVISGGIKIAVEEIEDQIAPLLEASEIRRPFFLWGLKDAALGQKLVLFIEGSELQSDVLLNRIKEACPRHKAPKAIIFAPRFQYTLSGKIDRIKSAAQWEKIN